MNTELLIQSQSNEHWTHTAMNCEHWTHTAMNWTHSNELWTQHTQQWTLNCEHTAVNCEHNTHSNEHWTVNTHSSELWTQHTAMNTELWTHTAMNTELWTHTEQWTLNCAAAVWRLTWWPGGRPDWKQRRWRMTCDLWALWAVCPTWGHESWNMIPWILKQWGHESWNRVISMMTAKQDWKWCGQYLMPSTWWLRKKRKRTVTSTFR